MNVNNLFYRQLTQWKGRFQKYTKSKFFREGMPFILFVVIGSFGLRELCTLRYELKGVQATPIPVSDEDEQKLMIREQNALKLLKTVNYEKWENKRIWRESDEGKIIP